MLQVLTFNRWLTAVGLSDKPIPLMERPSALMHGIAIRPGFQSCRKVASGVGEGQVEKDLISRED